MLSRSHRLGKDAEFSRVLEVGTKTKVGPLLFFHIPTDEPLRFGVVVSKKISKKAVERNYLRRLILELMARSLKEKPLTGKAVAVILYPPQNPKTDLEKAVTQWLARL